MRRIEIYTRHTKDQAKLNKASSLIATKIYIEKIKQRREGRELRQKLKDLPAVCRSGFVKMHFLKQATATLTSNM